MKSEKPPTQKNNGFLKGKINWGIIGCGDVAEVKSGPAFQQVKNSSLVAVMRRDKEKAKDFATRHQVPVWTTHADDLLYHTDINAIYVATPPSTHLEYTLKALEAGKNVYLEKPMTLNTAEARHICNAVDQYKGKLTVAHYRRKLPAFLKVKELIVSEEIGTITLADIQILQSKKSGIIANPEENWRLNPLISGGGYFHDLAPHQVDLMFHYFGEAKTAIGFSHAAKQNPLVEEIVNGIMAFKNGVQFRGIWNFTVPETTQKDSCTLYGTRGSIEFSFFGDTVRVTSTKGIETFSFKNHKHVQQPMIAATVDYFLGKGDNPCSAQEGLLVMETMEKLCGRNS